MTVKNIGFVSQAPNYAGNIVSVSEGKATPEKANQKLIDFSGKLIAQRSSDCKRHEKDIQGATYPEWMEEAKKIKTAELIEMVDVYLKQLDELEKIDVSNQTEENIKDVNEFKVKLTVIFLEFERRANSDPLTLVNDFKKHYNCDEEGNNQALTKAKELVASVNGNKNVPDYTKNNSGKFIPKFEERINIIEQNFKRDINVKPAKGENKDEFAKYYKNVSTNGLVSCMENILEELGAVKKIPEKQLIPETKELTVNYIGQLEVLIDELSERADKDAFTLYNRLNKRKFFIKMFDLMLKCGDLMYDLQWVPERSRNNIVSKLRDFAEKFTDKITDNQEEFKKINNVNMPDMLKDFSDALKLIEGRLSSPQGLLEKLWGGEPAIKKIKGKIIKMIGCTIDELITRSEKDPKALYSDLNYGGSLDDLLAELLNLDEIKSFPLRKKSIPPDIINRAKVFIKSLGVGFASATNNQIKEKEISMGKALDDILAKTPDIKTKENPAVLKIVEDANNSIYASGVEYGRLFGAVYAEVLNKYEPNKYCEVLWDSLTIKTGFSTEGIDIVLPVKGIKLPIKLPVKFDASFKVDEFVKRLTEKLGSDKSKKLLREIDMLVPMTRVTPTEFAKNAFSRGFIDGSREYLNNFVNYSDSTILNTKPVEQKPSDETKKEEKAKPKEEKKEAQE